MTVHQTCAACGQPLVPWRPGQAAHPQCDPAEFALIQTATTTPRLVFDVPDLPPPTASPNGAAPDDQQEPEPSRFKRTLLRRSQLRGMPGVQPLISGVLSRRSAAVLVGPTTAGKTFVALSWACSVATGHNWLGRDVHRTPVLYVVGEGATGLDARITAWEKTWGVGVGDDDLIVSVRPDSLSRPGVWQQMAVEAADLGVGFVILDTFSSLAPDADETKDAAVVTRRMADLAGIVDGTVLLVHHPGWGDPERTRGGSQLEANPDEVLLLRGNGRSDLIELDVKKVKEGAPGPPVWLRRAAREGSCVIEAVSAVEKAEQSADLGERVVRTVFGGMPVFSQAQLRDALIERLEVSRTTAYEYIRNLVDNEVVRRAGGSNGRPTYELVS